MFDDLMIMFAFIYPPVIKHGVLENTRFIAVNFLVNPQVRVDSQLATFDYRRVTSNHLGKLLQFTDLN